MSLNNVQVVRMLSLYRLVHFGIYRFFLFDSAHISGCVCIEGQIQEDSWRSQDLASSLEAKMKAGCSDIKCNIS